MRIKRRRDIVAQVRTNLRLQGFGVGEAGLETGGPSDRIGGPDSLTPNPLSLVRHGHPKEGEGAPELLGVG